MDIKKYIKNSLFKLRLMGIESRADEQRITDGFLQMPQDMLEDLEQTQILGMILDDIGAAEYDIESAKLSLFSKQLYSFDMEVFDTGTMYTVFLNALGELADGELEFSDINEDTSKVDFDAGTGIQTVAFTLNGQEYHYDASVHYDWFDPEIIRFINSILEEQNCRKAIYATSDGFQNCIIFYTTVEWADGFNVNFPELPIERM